MRYLHHDVSGEEAGQTLRQLIPRIFHLSTHAFRRLKVRNGICVNDNAQHVSSVVKAGDRITIRLETEDSTKENAEVHADLIRYMDEDMIILDKPAPMATLPGNHDQGTTLRDLLADVLGYDASYKYHPVNRLDKGTSGLLCIARHDHAQHLLTAQLHQEGFLREYLAIVEGIPAQVSGRIDLPIGKVGTGARRAVMEGGKSAITNYITEYSENGLSLVRLRLETGRTHQIRVHMAAMGTPILGDYLYGHPQEALQDRFALHSFHLACKQPITGEPIDITSPLPDVLARYLPEYCKNERESC
ncbi:MAG: RluA family pseudouridine synthase [Clostridia bacterium]|nr:RluA family pseudouridine synthase [Clostridia bacterium]